MEQPARRVRSVDAHANGVLCTERQPRQQGQSDTENTHDHTIVLHRLLAPEVRKSYNFRISESDQAVAGDPINSMSGKFL
jgi:hypothetical protein